MLTLADIVSWNPDSIDGNLYLDAAVAAVTRADRPPAGPHDSVLEAADRMRAQGVDAVAVIDHERVGGTVTRRDLAIVEILVDRLTGDTRDQ